MRVRPDRRRGQFNMVAKRLLAMLVCFSDAGDAKCTAMSICSIIFLVGMVWLRGKVHCAFELSLVVCQGSLLQKGQVQRVMHGGG